MNLPQARTNELIEQELDGELLIYDLQNDKAYTLNATSMTVYKACDGKQTFEDLKTGFGFSDEIIYFTLDQLNANNLLDGTYVSPLAHMNRREVVRQIGFGTMVALPMIAGVIAPRAVQAASCVNPGGIATGQSAAGFGCSSGTAAQCAAICDNTAAVRNSCCTGRASAQAGGTCGLANCCICA